MKKKIIGLLILLSIYAVTFLVGLIIVNNLKNNMHILNAIFIANVIATILIWIVGMFFKTASIYDPYWSIQTIAIYIPLMIYTKQFNLGSILLLICLLFWAIRLTINFIITFNDISYIDWRYKMLNDKTKKFYPIVNLFGIHMVPTLIVYIASIPSFLYLLNANSFSFLNIFGLLIMVIATIIELISDINMHNFKKIRKSKEDIINVGLWKYSRHPNYFGEILFWYGLALVFILSNLNMWYVIIGAILNNCLFLFISIPLAENHMKLYKPNYDQYKKQTRMLIPIKLFK